MNNYEFILKRAEEVISLLKECSADKKRLKSKNTKKDDNDNLKLLYEVLNLESLLCGEVITLTKIISTYSQDFRNVKEILEALREYKG